MKTLATRYGRKVRGKSAKYGNGNALRHGGYRNLYLLDMRTQEAKELAGILASSVADKGGADNLSSLELDLHEARAVVVWRRRRFAAAIVAAEAAGKSVSQSLRKDFHTAVELELKLSDKLGLKREAKPVENLQDYLKRRALETSQQPQQESEAQS